ncbi:MAG TPA: hypothetical protein VHE35_25260 [Kofleriaceae bacterium]|nr:hypothetical protein [Kofleriaceae bacterium]
MSAAGLGSKAALLALGGALAGACIDTPAPTTPPACSSAADCNAAAGEVCDEGVCWGNPPAGGFAAVLSPTDTDAAGRTEITPLLFSSSGWMTGDTDGAPRLVLASTVRLKGTVTAPCPAELTDCDQSFEVPATVKFTRASGIDEKGVVFEATTTGGDYQVVLPRPTEVVTYQVTVSPSDVPLAAGRPSAAELLAPRRLDIAVDPASGNDVTINLVLADAANLRPVSGTVVRPPPGNLTGWRVWAEAPSMDELGGFERVSNIARLDGAGGYRLLVPIDRGPVDVVVSPPAPTGTDVAAPGLRHRNVDPSQLMQLPVMTVPPVGDVSVVGVTVSGTSGGGDSELIDGARVVARMDEELAPDVYLTHRVIAATNEYGVAALQLWAPPAGALRTNDYAIDVLPASGSEQATHFGWPLSLEPGDAPTVAIPLERRMPIRGTVLDEHGVGVGGASVSAAIAQTIRCDLDSGERMLVRGLPSVAGTTAPDGTFVLWVDPDLGDRDLRYDVHVEPPPDSAPSWTYADVAVGGDVHQWRLPEAAHVRGQVVHADGSPGTDTLVSVYEHVDDANGCASGMGAAPPGSVQVRAVGRTDADGVVRLVLPRVGMATSGPPHGR